MNRPLYWKTRLDEVDEIVGSVKKGTVHTVAKSPGGRNIYLVEYGRKQDFNRTANYSSACGAGDAKYYANKTGKKPVLFIIGAEHGSELEGTAAILNLIQLIETGKDFAGNTNPYLFNCIEYSRLLLIPIANPDGRARIDIDSMHGLNYEDFRHYAQGRWKDGTLCDWPNCKTVHPMTGYSFLGAYYNDDGINLVHDNFFGRMAKETQAIFDIADESAPDIILHLHGGTNMQNEVIYPNHVPTEVKRRIHELGMRVKAEAAKHGLPMLGNDFNSDENPHTSFNIMSALHHVCGGLSILYESNQGIDFSGYRELDTSWEALLSCEEILALHYILFKQSIKYALETDLKCYTP